LDGGRFERMGELEMREKFAEGGQVELYDVHIKCFEGLQEGDFLKTFAILVAPRIVAIPC
jgi:hypothetical protein